MSNPFVAEIRIFGFNFAPTGWAQCNGQILPISQNTALFSLLGTTYGGDGKSNFGLPNFQGSAPLGSGQGAGLSIRDLGETGGEDAVTLLTTEMPIHTHQVNAFSGAGTSHDPTGNVWASAQVLRQGQNLYGTAGGATMSPQALSPNGGNLPHNNLMPYLVLNFCIAMQGVFPPRS
ncbi:MAG TPA: tail fiber protein [Anaerolineales bacterium]|nr:tail fiber protein [Anaerolineales bacterium]